MSSRIAIRRAGSSVRTSRSDVPLDALVSPSCGKRPELADEPMRREGGLRLLRRERLEAKVESGCVPVTPEVIDSLRVTTAPEAYPFDVSHA